MFGVIGDDLCSNRCRFISVKGNNMSDNSASIYNKWNVLFRRTTDYEDGTPRFSLKGAVGYLSTAKARRPTYNGE
jgi:hypothetical protein